MNDGAGLNHGQKLQMPEVWQAKNTFLFPNRKQWWQAEADV